MLAERVKECSLPSVPETQAVTARPDSPDLIDLSSVSSQKTSSEQTAILRQILALAEEAADMARSTKAADLNRKR